MAHLIPIILITTLNVNSINIQIKRKRVRTQLYAANKKYTLKLKMQID